MADRKGKVWLVGAGPSDPALLTVKGRELIESADTIVYDNLVGQGVLSLVPSGKEVINVGKVAGNHPVKQEEINKILLDKALEGKKVVRLKGGDPFVFGRGGEELELLIDNKVPFEIVPGVTSAVAVAAYSGIPVTHRDFTSSFHVITGHTKKKDEADIDFEALVKLDGTLIFLMGVGSMDKICRGLINAGMNEDMPAAVLEKGTRAAQRKVVATVSTLFEEAQKAEIKTPAIIMVGRVCALADRFEWASHRILGKLKIGVSRPEKKASSLAKKLGELGSEVVLLPSIYSVEIEDEAVREAFDNIEKYTWIALTSPTAVEIFMKKLLDYNMDVRDLAHHKFAVVGKATQRKLLNYGIKADLMPEKFTGAYLGALLCKEDVEGKILIPRSKIGGQEIIKALEEGKKEFDDIGIYDTEFQNGNNIVSYTQDIDLMAFTSASTVKSFVANNKDVDFSQVVAVCIGSETAKEAQKYGMKVNVSPKATIDDMVDFIVEKFGS